jgi:hypothetical protein
MVLSLCVSLLLPGCWWQRDAYTQRMQAQMARFERDAEYDRVLDVPFESVPEFPMWIRPPKPTERRKLDDLEGVFLGLFQGTHPGGALIEVLVMGSAGSETMSEFEQKAFEALNKANKGSGGELKRQDPASVNCMHGGQTSFEVYSGGGARQFQGAATPTNYQWVCYFAEEGTQKVMIAFIVPDNDYTAFADAMVKCLESLALGSKVSAARSGTTVAPAQSSI